MTATEDGGAVTETVIRPTGLTEPLTRSLVFRQWTEMALRYEAPPPCSEDDAIPSGRFDPPDGLFLLAERAGEAVGCGGYRPCAEGPPGTAEVKRLFVDPTVRGTGLGRLVMEALEAAAAVAGYERLWLETGTAQPEAIALYDTSGYDRIEPYGEYKESPLSVCFAKDLSAGRRGSA